MTQLQGVKPLTLPRCYYAGTEGEVIASELHGFRDASAKAYGAVFFSAYRDDACKLCQICVFKNTSSTSLGADHTASRTVIRGSPVKTDP